MVCKPKDKGGLGVVNFHGALLIKFLDKFYNKLELPWVQLIWHAYDEGNIPHVEDLRGSFWWQDVLKQVDNFRGVKVAKLGRGDTFF
jgi:hypothetical protein